jgi:hypothetical protein
MWASGCVSFRDAKGCDGLRGPLRFSGIRRGAVAKRSHCWSKKDEGVAYGDVVVGESVFAVVDVRQSHKANTPWELTPPKSQFLSCDRVASIM